MRYEMSREDCANKIEREHHVSQRSLGYVHNFFFFGRLSQRLTKCVLVYSFRVRFHNNECLYQLVGFGG